MKNISIAFLLIIYITKLPAQTIFVNGNLATNGDGTSWLSAFNNLQDAISEASASNEIWLVKGTYFPSKDTTGNTMPVDNRSKTFYINKNIKIYGGFFGNESSVSAANPTSNETILSGDIGVLNDNLDNAYHVIWMSSASGIGNINNSCVFNGVTITKGYGDSFVVGAIPNNQGGGIYFNAIGLTKTMSPKFENCIFKENSARQGGGLFFNTMGNTVEPLFEKCDFVKNHALGNMPSNPNGAGGAIHFSTRGELKPSFNNCTFAENKAGSAGVIYNILYAGNSYPVITNCYFIKNSATTGGVMYNCSNSTGPTNKPTIVNSVFSENTASSIGACIYNIANSGETSPNIVNCTFSKNSAPNGPTIYNTKQPAAICNPTIKNSLIWNVSTSLPEIFNNASSTTTIINCLYSDGAVDGSIMPSTGNTFVNSIDANPLFININDLNGADNQFRTSDDGLNVMQNSPILNMGDNGSLPIINTTYKSTKVANNLAVDTDITGINQRIIQGNIDIGAFEMVIFTPLPLNFISFYAKTIGGNTELNWQTSNEINTQSFDIERSRDSNPFIKIGEISAKNNSEINNYSFNDSDFSQNGSVYYYRIKQLDFDGKSSFSKIISVKFEDKSSFFISPNPVKDFAKINFEDSFSAIENVLQINDLSGKKVLNFKLKNSENRLDLRQLPAGIYFLINQNGKSVRIIKE
jgi:Secretion system C-terminal sorting domain